MSQPSKNIYRFWDGTSMVQQPSMIYALVNGMVFKHEGERLIRDETKPVIPMQCTGERDRKGVDIYEGDIVRWGMIYKTGISVIEWFQGFGFWHTNKIGKKEWCLVDSQHEIIGNIYQNHELLSKDGKNEI